MTSAPTNTVIFTINNDKIIQTVLYFLIDSWSYFGENLIFESSIYNSVTFATAYNAVNWNQIELNEYKNNAANKAFGFYLKSRGTVQIGLTNYDIELNATNSIAIEYALLNSDTLKLRHATGVVSVASNLLSTLIADYKDLYMDSYNQYIDCVDLIYSATDSNGVDAALNNYMGV